MIQPPRHRKGSVVRKALLLAWVGLFSLGACSLETVLVLDPEVLGAISGQITVVGGGGLPDVTVRLAGVFAASTVTDGSGSFSFQRVAGGGYSVTISDLPANITFIESQKSATVSTSGESVTVDFQGAYPPVDVATTVLATGHVGVAYSDSVRATGGPGVYSWSIVGGSLPPGLDLALGTASISGTPTSVDTSTFTVQAATPADRASKQLTVYVYGSVTVTTTLRSGATGVAYSDTLTAAGGDGSYAWAVTGGSLPTGLWLNRLTGEISGTPSAFGTSSFTVGVTSGDGQTAQQALSITVEPEGRTLSPVA